MADQKSRGGQKEVAGQAQHHDEQRGVHPHDAPQEQQGRNMKEDAARGQHDNQGGCTEEHRKQQEQSKS